MHTSGEKEGISNEAKRVQSVSLYSNHCFHILIRSLSGLYIYNFIVCNAMKKLMKQGLGLIV